MKRNFLIGTLALLVLMGLMSACDFAPKPDQDLMPLCAPAFDAKDAVSTIPDEIIDLSSYKAGTQEAQAMIDLLAQGKGSLLRSISGGVSDETIAQFRANRLAESQDALISGRMPGAKPTTASSRPKITWLAKIGGPGETYWANKEYSTVNPGLWDVAGYQVTAYSEKIWHNNDNNILNDYGYQTAMFQTVGGTERLYRHMMSTVPGGTVGHTTHSLTTCENDSTANPYIYFQLQTIDGTSEYDYFNVPSGVFEDPNAYPIQETWYWNPPYHFTTLAMIVKPDGSVSYGTTTKEGYENQIFIYRWSVKDFKAAYSGWHAQGWYIKDIDVEEGIVSAILYVPASAYSEKLLLYYNDTTFSTVLGTYWNMGYRGIMIDSSW